MSAAAVRQTSVRRSHRTVARPEAAAAGRIVVKLGTNVVLRADGTPAAERIAAVVGAIARLRAAGREVLVVSSGAVGLGARQLGRAGAGAGELRQACAAIGQSQLMSAWCAALVRRGLVPAQVLLTSDDFADARRADRVVTTLTSLLACGAVPVINENDALSSPDSQDGAAAFRDNDMLAALIGAGVGASLLVLLSDVDGVFTSDPATAPDATLLATVHELTPALLAGARAIGVRGRGGMAAKLAAAARAVAAGVPTVIANGHSLRALDRIAAGEAIGTLLPTRANA